jgi:methionine aminotransferase
VASYAAISTENDVAFCKVNYRIWRGSNSISTFMKTERPPFDSLFFAKDNATLEEAAKRLCKI